MPGTPATSPTFGAPRYADSDDATFAEQVNSVTDVFDALAVRSDDARLSDARTPAPGSVTAATIPNASITGGKLAAQTVTQANMAPDSIGSAQLIDASIQTADYAPGSVTSSVLAPGAVHTSNVGDAQITTPKLDTATQQALSLPGDLIYSAATTRPGAVLCDGRTLARTDPLYAALFAAIGTTYGGGDGVSTFNVPDYRGRVAVMVGSSGQNDTWALGQKYGEPSHVLTANELAGHAHGLNWSDPGHRHTLADPGHAHSVADPGHQHSLGYHGGLAASGSAQAVPDSQNTQTFPSVRGYTGISLYNAATGVSANSAATGIAASVQSAGGSYAHNNCQPSVGVNVFVKL